MAATLEQIRDGLADALKSIFGMNVLARMQQVTAPAAIVEVGRIDYHDTMDLTSAVYMMNVIVLVGTNDLVTAQKQLDAYISPDGPKSVRAAIEDNETLGGVVSDLIVRGADSYQEYDVGGETFLGAIVSVEVRP